MSQTPEHPTVEERNESLLPRRSFLAGLTAAVSTALVACPAPLPTAKATEAVPEDAFAASLVGANQLLAAPLSTERLRDAVPAIRDGFERAKDVRAVSLTADQGVAVALPTTTRGS